jgi:hypothetical protein
MDRDAAYLQFVDTVRPVALYLKSSHASLDRAAFWRVSDDGADGQSAVNRITVTCSLADAALSEFDVTATAIFALDDEAGRPLLRVESEFDLHFESPQPLRSDFAERFAQVEARLVIWPYFREFISNMTARMGIPPVAIPLTLGHADRAAN